MYKFWQKRDWNCNCAFMVPPNTHSLMKRRAVPLQPPKIIYFCKFRPQRAWNYGYLACKIQNFLRQGYVYILTEKGLKLCIYGSSKYTFSYEKHEKKSCPLQPPDIIHFCQLKPKRAWNYAYLACKIQNFLRQAGGSTPLQPPKLYKHIKTDFPPATTRNHIFLY